MVNDKNNGTMTEDEIANIIFDKAVEVHKVLGPGLLERCYQQCLALELHLAGLKVETEKVLPVYYKGYKVEVGFRMDILVEDKVIIECKTVSEFNDAHLAQTINYLKLSKLNLGILINFHAPYIGKGFRRVYNNYYKP